MTEPRSTRIALSWRRPLAAGITVLAVAATVVGLRLAPAHGSTAAAPLPAAPATSPSLAPLEAPPTVDRIALGRAIFFDPALSEPPGTSCASCHDPSRGFAGNHGSTVGVARGSRPDHPARRNTPSVMYLRFVPRFHLHWEEDAPLVDAYGGFFWDGRTDSLAELTKQPLLEADEMNNESPASIARKVAAAPYAPELRRLLGDAGEAPDAVLHAMGEAVEAYLLGPDMAPFSSRYDDYVRRRGELTATEALGLRLFKDSAKGGCSACHKLNDTIPAPERSLFTDYGYDALAPPRNRALPANRDPARFDLGLCQRPDPRYHTDGEQFCGSFRTPSLRNVAVRTAFMHNGVFGSLRDVVTFYATRSTDPKRWYPHRPTFDDVPARYREYVNVDKAPYNRQEGEKPALDEHEVDAIVAFLGTLTDAAFR
ncbi:MAG: cytochrome c peroxidase [Polyangiaceae bacterium]|jgi:cytochrome c peroxidase